MLRYSAIGVSVWLWIYTQVCLGQTASPKPAETTLDVQVADILHRSRVPGGIEIIRGCESVSDNGSFAVLPEPSQTLARLSEVHPHLVWKKVDNTYTVSIRLTQSPSITSIIIPKIDLKIVTLSAAVDALLQEPSVAKKITEMNFRESLIRLGPSSVNEHELRKLQLREASLGDDLNRIATVFGAAVWELDQWECQGKKLYVITWISK
jgi:hypothetical protein